MVVASAEAGREEAAESPPHGPPPSSLAYTDQTGTRKVLLTCSNAPPRVVVELFSGQVFPDRCRVNACLFCLPLNARRRAMAIELAAPERMVRISLVARSGDLAPHVRARMAMKRIDQYLEREGLSRGEWCWTIEENPKETGFHAHAVQRGDYIPQAALQEASVRAGAGIPYINRIRRGSDGVARYGLKGFGADGYGLKTFRPTGDQQKALFLNGGRLEHHSRGFFHIDGSTARVREVEREAISRRNKGKPIAFLACAPGSIEEILSSKPLRSRLIRHVVQEKRESVAGRR